LLLNIEHSSELGRNLIKLVSLDFIAENMGVYFYNKGLQDAQAILASKVDDIAETIAANEITTKLT